MYCGASPNINALRTNACAKKYMHITMASYIELHTQNKRTCHESSSLAVRLFTITGAIFYKFHTMPTGAQCFNNSSTVVLVKLFLLAIAFLVVSRSLTTFSRFKSSHATRDYFLSIRTCLFLLFIATCLLNVGIQSSSPKAP